MAFGTDESVLFREVSLIQGVHIERFHCIRVCVCIYICIYICIGIYDVTHWKNILSHSVVYVYVCIYMHRYDVTYWKSLDLAKYSLS